MTISMSEEKVLSSRLLSRGNLWENINIRQVRCSLYEWEKNSQVCMRPPLYVFHGLRKKKKKRRGNNK